MATVAPNVTLIVDDRDPRIQYHCPVIKETVKGSYFRDTWTSIDSLSCGLQLGWFSYSFNGTQVRISVTDSQANQDYSVKIDNGPFVGLSGNGFYESPVLPDGPHTVVYSAGNQSTFPAFDYLTVAAGASTQLFGQTVIVDDAAITSYAGKWNTQPIAESPFVFSRPLAIYQNTTHWTNTTGDSFMLQFQGTSIAVVGIIPDTDTGPGNSTVSCTIDGVSAGNTTLPMSTTQVQPMLQLCRADGLAAGTHTLVFNATALAPAHSLGVDFVVYNSSVNTTPMSSGAGSTIQSPIASTTKRTSHTPVIIGATIGAMGALVLLLLCLLVVVCRRRTRARKASRVNSRWHIVSKAEL